MSSCVFSFGAPTYLKFDLTAIASATVPFTPSSGIFANSSFAFRFCSPIPGVECDPDALPTSSLLYDPSKICAVSYGVSTYASALALADGGGLVLTYAGGTGGAFSTFTLRCDPLLPAGLLAVDGLEQTQGGVGLAYSMRAAAACGADVPREVAPLGLGWILFLALAGACVAYFGGGALYNRRTTGARGLEAVPHIHAMRAAWARLTGRGTGAADGEYSAVGGEAWGEEPSAPPGAKIDVSPVGGLQ